VDGSDALIGPAAGRISAEAAESEVMTLDQTQKGLVLHDPARVWAALPALPPEARALAETRLIFTHRDDPAGRAFEVLRTRLLQALADHGWTRVAVTAPTRGCGKSFVAANLALSLARRPGCRVLLVDLDLATPGLARHFGVERPGRLADALEGRAPFERHLLRVGTSLLLALNGTAEKDAAAILHGDTATYELDSLDERLKPDVVLHVLPPALGGDEVLGFLPEVDCVLLVADATQTEAQDLRDCEALFSGQAPLLGVVLNRVEEPPGKSLARLFGRVARRARRQGG
jgi:Mrp family chromosome partitioning ATPase